MIAGAKSSATNSMSRMIPSGVHADEAPCIELRRIFRFFGTTKAHKHNK